LTIEGVEVRDPQLTQARIADILAELNKKYASQNVIFVTERPATAEYSTIFIGKTEAFDQYGNFAGLAETVDFNNQNHSDNAFVNLDSTATDEQIISTISHETDHLLGTLSHGGEGLNAYAAHTIVYAGTTSTGLVISSGNSITVSSGGVANSTTVNSAGYMFISSGGTATAIKENGGCVEVYYGANVTFVSNTITGLTLSGNMTVHKNTVANSTTVNRGGVMYISSGGTANSTTVNSAGCMYIFSGGVANSTTVNYYGYMNISSGGVANSTTVNSGGDMYIYGGGSVTAIRENGGYVDVANGANVTFVSNTITGLRLLYDSMTVHKNTVANSTTVNYGYMYISSGGVANSTTLSGGDVYYESAAMYISSGGVANNTTVNSYCYMYISSGGMANSTTVNYGYMYISSGGVANSTTVNSGGGMYIYSGGIHRGTLQINSGAWIYAYSGSTIDFTLTGRSVSNGYLINDLSLISGTPTFTITVSDSQESGTYKLAQGAEDFTGPVTIGTNGKNYGTLRVNGSALGVSTNAYRLTENNGNLQLTISRSAADLNISNYQVSNSGITTAESVKLTFTINNTGTQTAGASTLKVYDGDVLLCTVAVDSIAAGSSRNCTITIPAGKLSEGTHKIYVIADANNVIAESNENNNNSYRTIFVKAPPPKPDLRMAEYNVSSNSITTQESVKLTFKVYNDGDADAPASTIKVYDGDRLLREVALGEIAAGGSRSCYITLSAGKLSAGTHKVNVVLDAGNGIAESNENNNNSYRTIFVFPAYSNLTVSGSSINLISRGTANVTNIYNGGNMTVTSGGSASDTTIHSAGKMIISSGGTATKTVINSSGTFSAGPGAIVNSLTLNRYGSMSLRNSSVNKLTLNSRASATVTDLHIFGATINSSAHLTCRQNMVLSGGVICSDGKITMSSGTVVSAVTVSKAGTLNVKNGGCARNIEIQREGKFIMLGTASNTTLFGGSMYVGDSAYENYDGTGGMPTSNVYDEDIHASKNTLQSSWLHIYSGGTATRNVVNSNSWLHVYYGGTATRNVVNSSGYLTVQDSGTANSATVHSGGYMRLYTGAILKGDINVGGKVTVHRAGTSATEDVIRAYGADINFLVNERRTTDSAIITDFGMIMGATYYLTVSDQAAGVYSLASGASDFTGSITVNNLTGGTMGTLRVNTLFASRGKTYRLLKESGTLKLRVTDNQSLADLAVSNYQVSSTSVSSEGSFKLTFTISNQGYANAGSSTIKVYDDTDTLLRTVSFNSLASGASRNCSITINALKLTPGARKIYVVADANDVVSEVNGLNNRAYRTVTINKAKADLVVQDFALSKNSITTSESVKLTFKVINKGGTDAPETMIKIYDGDKLLREVALGEIAAGGSRNCTVTITSGKLSVGTHKIYAKIDSDNVVPELYESNNNSYRTIFVKEPVRSLAAAPKENNSWDVCGTGSVDTLCGGNYADLNEWSLENSAALTRSAADILTTDKEESRLLNSGKLAG